MRISGDHSKPERLSGTFRKIREEIVTPLQIRHPPRSLHVIEKVVKQH